MITQFGLEQETFKTLLEKVWTQGSRSDALERLRHKAWDVYTELKLPHTHTEVYRYIKLRQLFAQPYQLPVENSSTRLEFSSAILPECQDSCLVFINGYFVPHLSRTENIPERVVVLTLQEAIRTYHTFLNNQWTQALKEETDPFVALNGALHQTGAFLYLPPKTTLETPIQILHIIDHEQQQLLMPRLQVFVGAQSNLQLITTQMHQKETNYFINHVTDLTIEEGSHVHVTQLFCDEHPQSWHLDALRATLKRDSTLKTVCVTEGSATVRTDYRVNLAGENAEALLNGVWMLAEKREAHTHVLIDHQAPYCRSFQLFKGVLNDFSRSSFEGKIMVRRPAQKTEAFQLNNNLLLSDHAQANSKPNLEIFADDVKASHGATIGQLDAEQLFYMKTRGFSDEASKNLLVYGFCEQVIEQIPILSMRQNIAERARSYLAKG